MLMTSNYSFDNLKLSMPFLKRERKTLAIEVRDLNLLKKETQVPSITSLPGIRF